MTIDYLETYMKDGSFDLPRLINDDFVEAMKLLFNNRHYTSCAKLLLSFIDTMAYLDTGLGDADSFKNWLNKFVDLASVGITADELWEHRNSLLHMTNIESRKVRAGKALPLMAFVSQHPVEHLPKSTSHKFYNLHHLMKAVWRGLELWFKSLNDHPERFEGFFERYDEIISDVRKVVMMLPDGTPSPQAG